MDDEGLAILRALVDGPEEDTGFTEGMEEGTQCAYCVPRWVGWYKPPWDKKGLEHMRYEHETTCPIRRARAYLAIKK